MDTGNLRHLHPTIHCYKTKNLYFQFVQPEVSSDSNSMAPENRVVVLEHWQAAPAPGTVAELSFPLTFCDTMWIWLTPPVQRLVFYELPVSRGHFIDTIVPRFKNSLSLALQCYPALAGKLILSPDLIQPEIRYVDGDSVPLIFAESGFRDFDYLVSNQARNCNELYPLIPQLPKSSKSPGITKVPLVAFQVTLFPGIGICIGISNQHTAADGSSMYAFTRAWTVLSRLGEDGIATLGNESLPFCDRDVMKDTKELDEMIWKHMTSKLGNGSSPVDEAKNLDLETDKVRATFVLAGGDVQRLKNYVKTHRSSIKHLSSFTVACAYIWSCLVKSGNAISDRVEEDGPETEYFGCVADCRGRTDPPVPANYFGNCLSYCIASVRNSQLTGDEGLAIAAELIGEAIHERLKDKESPFKDLGSLFSDYSTINMDRVLSIAGSPRQNYYDMDFGWGKPRKFEFVSIDLTGAMSISGSSEPGSLEIGLCLSKQRMDAFEAFFHKGLNSL